MMKLKSLIVVSALLIELGFPVQAKERSPLQNILEHPVLDAAQTLKEVQAFTASRVPHMPKVHSVKEWERIAKRMRREILDQVVFRGATFWRNAKTRVEWLKTIPGGPGYRIRKLRYEALPGFWIPALLYEPAQLSGKVPVVLNVNGHDLKNGKAAVYKQIRCINQAKRGMIALDTEWIGMGQLATPGNSHGTMNQLDLCGVSGLAPFYLAMSRALDLLLDYPHADAERVAVTGLSGGGWQTIIISSLDTRVKLCNPVAGYSSFRTRAYYLTDLGDSEQTPNDLATIADYTHLTAMLAPRPVLLTYNKKDNCCFASDHALPPLLQSAGPIYKLYDRPENLRSHVNYDPGTHNFEIDNRRALYRLLGDFFFPDDASYSANEIPCKKELKTFAELTVPLPDNNLDLHKLALQAMKSLPRKVKNKVKNRGRSAEDSRSSLQKIVRAKTYQVVGKHVGTKKMENGAVATFWRLKLGTNWTVPAVEFAPAGIKGTTIVLADHGRASLAPTVKRLLKEKQRVLAVDPFYFGESRIGRYGWLFGLLVAAVGDRPLGIEAGQMAAIARWSGRTWKSCPVAMSSQGPRTSLIALIAAGIEPLAIGALHLQGSLRTLKQRITSNGLVETTPEMFCFGLLEEFDIPQLISLVKPRPFTVDYK